MENLTTTPEIKKANKYNYILVIQQHFGSWEDVSEYEADSQQNAKEYDNKILINSKGREYKETLLKHDLREYQRTGYPTRVIFRKELNKIN
jgi:hypothetical protein